jgi:hypothetical protein
MDPVEVEVSTYRVPIARSALVEIGRVATGGARERRIARARPQMNLRSVERRGASGCLSEGRSD